MNENDDSHIAEDEELIEDFRALVDRFKADNPQTDDDDAAAIWEMCFGLLDMDMVRAVTLVKHLHFHAQIDLNPAGNLHGLRSSEECEMESEGGIFDDGHEWLDGWDVNKIGQPDEFYQSCLYCGTRRAYKKRPLAE